MNNILHFVIWLAVAVIALGIIYYILTKAPLPAPLRDWVNIVIVVIGGIFLIMLLLSLAGGGPLPRFG